MNEFRYYLCDVFTDRAFQGNPLAVLSDARGLDSDTMQAIAREFNFSETAFVTPPDDPQHTARVRIFTPAGELPFAGHPTIGTAFVLGSIGAAPGARELVFEEGIGPLRIAIDRDRGRIVRCTLTAARSPEQGAAGPPEGKLAQMLGIQTADFVGPAECWSCGVPFLVVSLASIDALTRARLHYERWSSLLGGSEVSNLYLVAPDGESSWRVRMFAPGLGMGEDPATGAAAAALAGWLVKRTPTGPAARQWTIRQGTEIGRPSTIYLEADVEAERAVQVRIGGAAVMIGDGMLRL